MGIVYCLNFQCDKKEQCERGKLMNKEWFKAHASQIDASQMVHFNYNKNSECEHRSPIR